MSSLREHTASNMRAGWGRKTGYVDKGRRKMLEGCRGAYWTELKL